VGQSPKYWKTTTYELSEGDQARHGVGFTLAQYCCAAVTDVISLEGTSMSWTKPEAEVVAVTMEVTAYVATL